MLLVCVLARTQSLTLTIIRISSADGIQMKKKNGSSTLRVGLAFVYMQEGGNFYLVIKELRYTLYID